MHHCAAYILNYLLSSDPVYFTVILHQLWSTASVKGLPVQQWIAGVLWECLGVGPAVNFDAVELWLAETLSLTPSLMVHQAHQPRWSISVLLSLLFLHPSLTSVTHKSYPALCLKGTTVKWPAGLLCKCWDFSFFLWWYCSFSPSASLSTPLHLSVFSLSLQPTYVYSPAHIWPEKGTHHKNDNLHFSSLQSIACLILLYILLHLSRFLPVAFSLFHNLHPQLSQLSLSPSIPVKGNIPAKAEATEALCSKGHLNKREHCWSFQ